MTNFVNALRKQAQEAINYTVHTAREEHGADILDLRRTELDGISAVHFNLYTKSDIACPAQIIVDTSDVPRTGAIRYRMLIDHPMRGRIESSYERGYYTECPSHHRVAMGYIAEALAL